MLVGDTDALVVSFIPLRLARPGGSSVVAGPRACLAPCSFWGDKLELEAEATGS